MRKGILFWITGLAGAGKTTIGNRLYYSIKAQRDDVVLLDGDILKSIVDDKVGYSNEERRKRAYKYANLCKALVDQGLVVICCTIAMFEEVRKWNRRENKNYIEVFLDVPMEVLMERDQKCMYSKYRGGVFKNLAGIDVNVEYPENPDIVIKNDGSLSIMECVNKIIEVSKKYYDSYDRDAKYWDGYYSKGFAINEPSLFAKEVIRYIKPKGRLLDVGCGNGRDSLFFIKNGLNVTGIDISSQAINALSEKTKEYENSAFVCDDFVCSRSIYTESYDYIYSRFSLHAINKEQEKVFIENACNSLKKGGYLFIEVRSVNDELYGKGDNVGRDEFIYEGHYRRFIRKEELEKALENVRFKLLLSVEDTGFAPFSNENPKVIRIIAEKV